jgi:hypothetical protein
MDNLPKDYFHACRLVQLSDPFSGNNYNKRDAILKAVETNNENYKGKPFIGNKNHTFTVDGISFPVAKGVIVPVLEHGGQTIDYGKQLIDVNPRVKELDFMIDNPDAEKEKSEAKAEAKKEVVNSNKQK